MASSDPLQDKPSRRAINKDLLLIGLAFALACILYWPMLSAQWSVYADHEMQVYLGRDGVVHLFEIPQLILGTEVGYPGAVSRYRPTTYFMYVFESFLWGSNTTLWQSGRLAMLAISLAGITVAFGRFFSWPLAAALSTLLMTAPYWPTIWIGIGPNEQYIALYLVSFCWSYALLHGWPMSISGDNTNRPLAWLCCALSVAMLVGTKELAFMVLVPWIWLGFVTWRHERRLGFRWVPLLVPVVWSAFILTAIIIGVRANGADFYGNSISVSGRMYNLLSIYVQSPLRWMTLILAMIAGAYIIGKRTPRLRWIQIAPEKLKIAFVVQCALLLFGMGHAFFYDSWPTVTRYAFPGELFAFLSYVLALYLVIHAIAAFRPDTRTTVELAAALVVMAGALYVGFSPIKTTAAGYVDGSKNYTRAIEAILSASQRAPDVPIVVESATPYDLEPVFSVNRFLNMRNLPGQMFLRLHNLADADFPRQPFFTSMIATLEQLSSTGEISALGAAGTLPSPFLAKYTPIAKLPAGRCYSILLAKAPRTDCEVIAKISY